MTDLPLRQGGEMEQKAVEIVVTRADLITWERRVEEIDAEMGALSTERTRLMKKMSAAEVLFDG